MIALLRSWQICHHSSSGDFEGDNTALIQESAETSQQGSLSPTEGSREYLDLVKHMVDTLRVKLATEPAKAIDVVQELYRWNFH